MRSSLLLLSAFVFSTLASCGSPPPPVEPKADPPPEPEHKQMGAWGELGILDEGKVRDTFERIWRGDMEACRKKGNEFVAGDITVRVRINHQGGVKWAYLKASTLGDRAVESCILDVVRATTWPTPKEGDDGVAEQELPFAELADRPALEWPADNARATLTDAADKLAECKASGTITATIIVNTDGSVLSAGAYGPDEKSDAAIDCAVNVIRGLTFPKPGSWTAKTTVELP